MNLQEKKDVVLAFISFHYGMSMTFTNKKLTITQGRLMAAAIFLCLGLQLHLIAVNTYLAAIGPQMLDSRNPRGLQTGRSQKSWNGEETGK